MIFGNKILTDLDELQKLKIPKMTISKQKKMYHSPIRHWDIFEKLIHSAKLKFGNVNSERYALSNDKHEFVGSVQFAFNQFTDVKWMLSAGISNSTNMWSSMQIYGGCILNENDQLIAIPVMHENLGKHTENRVKDLPINILNFMDSLEKKFRHASNWLQKITQKFMKKSEILSYLQSAGQKKLIAWSRIGKIDSILSTHEESISVCDLIKTFSFVSQQSPPLTQMKNIYKFVEMVTA